MQKKYLYILCAALAVTACRQRQQSVTTPWGTEIGVDDDSTAVGGALSLDEIVSGGELIMLTISGPDNYFEYRGRSMGTQ